MRPPQLKRPIVSITLPSKMLDALFHRRKPLVDVGIAAVDGRGRAAYERVLREE